MPSRSKTKSAPSKVGYRNPPVQGPILRANDKPLNVGRIIRKSADAASSGGDELWSLRRALIPPAQHAPLPAVFTVSAATASGAPLIHGVLGPVRARLSSVPARPRYGTARP